MLALLPFALLVVLLDRVAAAAEVVERDGPGTQACESVLPGLLSRRYSAPSSLRRREAGITQLTLSSDGSSYYTLMSAGNIDFRIALDTASSDLWLMSSACSTSQCKAVPSYPLTYHSPSFGIIDNNGTTFNLSFADGTVSSGFLATESVRLENFTVPQQVIGVVDSANVSLKNQVSGILGLGFPRLSVFSDLTVNATPFISSLAEQGYLDYPFFGLSLTRNDTGSMSLGAIDGDIVSNVSSIEWNKVIPFAPFGRESNTSRYLQWAIRLDAISVNGTVVTPQPTYANITKNALALFDIGTNGMFGPYQDVTRIFELMEDSRIVDQDAGQWALPCNTEQVLAFNFGNLNFTMQPTDYLIGPTEGDPNECLTWPRAVGNIGDGIDWQLGTPFLRTVYSIFSYGIDDKEPPMIGLYPLSNITTIHENATDISSFFSSASATIATTLPNFILTTPIPATPSYLFNTSVRTAVGQIVSSDLGTSTYSPLIAVPTINASAIPTITPSPTLATLIITDASGMIITTTSHAPTTSVALGKPPGSGAASQIALSASSLHILILGVVLIVVQHLV